MCELRLITSEESIEIAPAICHMAVSDFQGTRQSSEAGIGDYFASRENACTRYMRMITSELL